MQSQHYLSELRPGQQATVQAILSRHEIKRRLEDLGLTAGCKVTCVFSAYSKDPIAYRVRGTLLALRKKDARNILIVEGGIANEESS